MKRIGKFMDYKNFLRGKIAPNKDAGFLVKKSDIIPTLFDFQKDIVLWACRKGRAAIFADCGLGKTAMQLEWCRQICRVEPDSVIIILAPLAVQFQTKAEAEKFGIEAKIVERPEDISPGINITNYEKLDRFHGLKFSAVVLDESSILKAFSGKTKNALIKRFSGVRYKLCCTATPAPNDYLELGNHSEFLEIMDSNEMISRWFINDAMAMGNYKLKGHATKDFWQWMSTWAVAMANPKDLGYQQEGFDLPPLEIVEAIVPVDHSVRRGDELFRTANLSSTTMHAEMRLTARDRAMKAASLVNGDFTIIWCNTNYEADELVRAIPSGVELRGSEVDSRKEKKLMDFSDGKTQLLITKPSLAGFGMNWQHCSTVIFVGLSYSYEQFYQALRRSWRFGQKRPVKAYIVIAESEGSILSTIRKKQEAHEDMKKQMNEAMSEFTKSNLGKGTMNLKVDTKIEEKSGNSWLMMRGDCCQAVKKIDSNSVHFTIFSPPFSNLYIYSDFIQDMGNSDDDAQFMEHFSYLIPELLRVTISGRLCSVHCKDLPRYRGRDGVAGLKDFPGMIIREFEKHGWTYHSRVTIWKDPVIEMQRTKNHGLLYKNFKVRGEVSRQGMADYLLTFRKWEGVEDTESVEPVIHDPEDFKLETWQKWASPVWDDIDQTNVLNFRIAREDKDEKHICPLQLDVIERAVKLWTNPGDLVFSPFAGIGSEGYEAIKCGRKFLGIELKEAYFLRAVGYLEEAEKEAKEGMLFSL